MKPFSSYWRDLWAFDRSTMVAMAVFTFLGGVTESLGLLLLVPLLVVVGATNGPTSEISGRMQTVMEAVGVPFTLGWILGVYVVLVSIRAGVGYGRSIVSARLRLQFVDHLRLRLFDALARADWRFHVERRASDLSHTLTGDLGRIGMGTNLVFDAFTKTVITAAYVFVAFRLSIPITLAAMAIATLLGAVLWPQVARSRRVGVLQTVRGKRSFSSQSEFFSGLKLAKSHGSELRHVDAFARETTDLQAATMDHQKSTALTQAGFQIGTVIAVAGLVWVAVSQLSIPSAELLTLVVVVSRIAPAASGILSSVQGAANMLPAYENAQRLLADAREAAEPAVPPRQPVALKTGIELVEVTFSYNADRTVLDAVSFELPARVTTALVGASGAGKTTLADVVLGLLVPDAGCVRVDGVPLDEVGLATWRAGLAYVAQDPFLFHDTLRSNITWGADVDEDRLAEVIEAAALTDVVAWLPDGLDTVVGDRGHRLSGGERQRVSLARALTRNPVLLVLDEATSALDSENERLVQAAIDRLHGELTILVIAHRLQTIRNADQIVVLDGGRVLEVGTWDDLVATGGHFSSLAFGI